ASGAIERPLPASAINGTLGNEDNDDGSNEQSDAARQIFMLATVRRTFVLPLTHVQNAEAKIRDRLDRRLMNYDRDLAGVPLAYRNLTILHNRVQLSYSPPVFQVPCSYEVL